MSELVLTFNNTPPTSIWRVAKEKGVYNTIVFNAMSNGKNRFSRILTLRKRRKVLKKKI